MSLLDGIAAMASAGGQLLMTSGTLTRTAWSGSAGSWVATETEFDLLANKQVSRRPRNANENRRAYDARLHIAAPSITTEPVPNDVVTLYGTDWIIWSVTRAPAGSHWQADVMAPPARSTVFLEPSQVSDGGGGYTDGFTPVDPVLAYFKEMPGDKALNAESVEVLNRAQVTVSTYSLPAGFDQNWRVTVEGKTYGILGNAEDDTNSQYRRLTLALKD